MKSLSYGEIVAISSEWKKYARKHGHDATTAMEFIKNECASIYPKEELQDEIFTLISVIEEPSE